MLQYFACGLRFCHNYLLNQVLCDLVFAIWGCVFHNLSPSPSHYKCILTTTIKKNATLHSCLLYKLPLCPLNNQKDTAIKKRYGPLCSHKPYCCRDSSLRFDINGGLVYFNHTHNSYSNKSRLRSFICNSVSTRKIRKLKCKHCSIMVARGTVI